MLTVVERKLGAATGRLYAEISDLVDLAAQAQAAPTRAALARVGLDVLCGAYHDLRAGAPNPKGDLVEALRRVPSHRSVDQEIAELVRRVLSREFAEDEAEGSRWVARALPQRQTGAPQTAAELEPIELTAREWRTFVWLYRYVEVYGLAPLLREMAAGLEIATIAAHDMLRRLERKGAVVNVGGHRGWLPVRAP